MTTGSHFKLTDDPSPFDPFNPRDPLTPLTPRPDQNQEYLIVSTKYKLQSDAFGSSGGADATGGTDAGPVFHCEFTALDVKTPYRPPRVTKKALVQGPQTAMVVGPAGHEIWTDQYGQVKVRFHWDRYSKSDEHSSCWIRVSHSQAGQGWGAVAIPRIGQEVVVDFLDGDPDRPLITGGVYNDVNMPPYPLPRDAAISGLRSNSTKGGGGYNEYIMDDTKGNELIREHAQFDKDSTIEHDLREHVRHDRSREVANNETIQVGQDRAKTIGNHETTTIGGAKWEEVGQDAVQVVGGDWEQKVGGTAALNAQHLIIEAGGSITLKVGGGYLVVDQTGVTVSNVPPNAPVINASTPPLDWLGKPEGTSFAAEQPPGIIQIRTIRQLCEKRPITGANVTLIDNKTTLKTDSDGYATFQDLEQRSYQVRIERKDFKPKQLSVVAKPDDDCHEVTLEPEWDLTLIPAIMRNNNWPIASQLMEHWFSRRAYEYPNPKDVSNGSLTSETYFLGPIYIASH